MTLTEWYPLLEQLIDSDGVAWHGTVPSLTLGVQIVFDECHKAKNLCPVGSSKPTKTGLTVLDLQNKLPKARVVYASATGECVKGQGWG